jgi:hypothetical protein
MDELSVLQYRKDKTADGASFKLVLLDFLELPAGDSSILSCCFKCEKRERSRPEAL